MTIVTAYDVKPRRNIELLLLVLAVAIALGCYAMVGIGTSDDAQVPKNIFAYGGGLLVFGLAIHILLRFRAPYADPVLLPTVVALNGIGLAMIHRIDLEKAGGEEFRSLASRQLVYAGIGVALACLVLFFLRDHRFLRRYTYVAMASSVILLLLPVIPKLGRKINGAMIWIKIGPFTFQPAELTKIALTVFFAGYLVSIRDQLALAGPKILGIRLPRGRDLGPLLVVWAVSIGVLVLQRDLGTSLLLFGLFVAMLYVATERASWAMISVTLFMAGAVGAWLQFSHVQLRVRAWLNAMDPDMVNGQSYQLVQGWFGMANGGLLGTGLGKGRPTIVPYVESDFILAGLGEELGLVGIFAILMMYMIVVQRALRIAIGVRDGFGKLLAAGLGFVVCLQVFVVAGGVTRVIPLTGLTLPFLAYGGSSLIANWMILALLLRISDAARRPAPTGEPQIISNDAATTQIPLRQMAHRVSGVSTHTPPGIPRVGTDLDDEKTSRDPGHGGFPGGNDHGVDSPPGESQARDAENSSNKSDRGGQS